MPRSRSTAASAIQARASSSVYGDGTFVQRAISGSVQICAMRCASPSSRRSQPDHAVREPVRRQRERRRATRSWRTAPAQLRPAAASAAARPRRLVRGSVGGRRGRGCGRRSARLRRASLLAAGGRSGLRGGP